MEIETISKPNQAYRTEEYAKLVLPMASAIMIEDELIVQGGDIQEDRAGAAILDCLNRNRKKRGFGAGYLIAERAGMALSGVPDDDGPMNHAVAK